LVRVPRRDLFYHSNLFSKKEKIIKKQLSYNSKKKKILNSFSLKNHKKIIFHIHFFPTKKFSFSSYNPVKGEAQNKNENKYLLFKKNKKNPQQ